MTEKYFYEVDQAQLSTFGTQLDANVNQRIKEKLELLREKCPSQCALTLIFDKREENYVGRLEVKSFSECFSSKKIAYDPYITYLLLEEDIESQLLEWKRKRFSKKLEDSLKRSTQINN